MKAEDLMIGDWVNLNFDVDYKIGNPIYGYVQVNSINKDGTIDVNCIFDISESMQDGWDLKLIKPIPLTPEILEKNCFYSVNECIFEIPISEEDLIRLIHVGKGWTVDAKIYAKGVNIVYGYFKYVHELQHALKLCGIKKDIIL